MSDAIYWGFGVFLGLFGILAAFASLNIVAHEVFPEQTKRVYKRWGDWLEKRLTPPEDAP